MARRKTRHSITGVPFDICCDFEDFMETRNIDMYDIVYDVKEVKHELFVGELGESTYVVDCTQDDFDKAKLYLQTLTQANRKDDHE